MAGGLFERYAAVIAELPGGRLGPEALLSDRFLLERGGDLAMYYIPFERLNPDAKVVLIGITPGITQMQVAYETARDGLRAGLSHGAVIQRVDEEASFAGSMRTNLNRMLDDLGLPALLGIESTEQLFRERSDLMHSTSALRNPVFVRGSNYTGSAPPIATTPLLRRVILEGLGPELAAVPSAVIVPLGDAAGRALQLLIDARVVDLRRCCLGFPHPSGANGHRLRFFQQRREQLAGQLAAWFQAPTVRPSLSQPSDLWPRLTAAIASALTAEERESLATRLRDLADALSG